MALADQGSGGGSAQTLRGAGDEDAGHLFLPC
jgi:hypothetical protein